MQKRTDKVGGKKTAVHKTLTCFIAVEEIIPFFCKGMKSGFESEKPNI